MMFRALLTTVTLCIVCFNSSLTSAQGKKQARPRTRHSSQTAVAAEPVICIIPEWFPEPKPPQLPAIYKCVEEMPQFPGDLAAFIAKNLRYPNSLVKEGFEGRVVISFIVRADGSVDSTQIFRSVHPLMNAEAERLISIMPRWKPGKIGGKAVDVRFTLPIVFKLD